MWRDAYQKKGLRHPNSFSMIDLASRYCCTPRVTVDHQLIKSTTKLFAIVVHECAFFAFFFFVSLPQSAPICLGVCNLSHHTNVFFFSVPAYQRRLHYQIHFFLSPLPPRQRFTLFKTKWRLHRWQEANYTIPTISNADPGFPKRVLRRLLTTTKKAGGRSPVSISQIKKKIYSNDKFVATTRKRIFSPFSFPSNFVLYFPFQDLQNKEHKKQKTTTFKLHLILYFFFFLLHRTQRSSLRHTVTERLVSPMLLIHLTD